MMRGYNFNKNLKGYQGIIDFFKKIGYNIINELEELLENMCNLKSN